MHLGDWYLGAWLPFEELVEHTAKREPVSRVVVLDTFLHHLRCHVTMGTTAYTNTNMR